MRVGVIGYRNHSLKIIKLIDQSPSIKEVRVYCRDSLETEKLNKNLSTFGFKITISTISVEFWFSTSLLKIGNESRIRLKSSKGTFENRNVCNSFAYL